MTAHITTTKHPHPNIPLKSSFIHLRTCGARRVKAHYRHPAVLRRKMSMLTTTTTHPLPPTRPSSSCLAMLRNDDSSFSSSSFSSNLIKKPCSHSSSLLLKSIRRGYVRRGTCHDRDDPVVSLANVKRVYRAPLKIMEQDDDYDDDSDEDDSADDDDSSCSCSFRAQEQHSHDDDSRCRTRAVTFDPQVSVVEIPSRKAYSRQVSEAMWNSRKQIKLSATRNAIEYAFEQRDWRAAMEEEDFIRCSESGALVHPAHVVVVALHHHQQQQGRGLFSEQK